MAAPIRAGNCTALSPRPPACGGDLAPAMTLGSRPAWEHRRGCRSRAVAHTTAQSASQARASAVAAVIIGENCHAGLPGWTEPSDGHKRPARPPRIDAGTVIVGQKRRWGVPKPPAHSTARLELNAPPTGSGVACLLPGGAGGFGHPLHRTRRLPWSKAPNTVVRGRMRAFGQGA